LELSSVSTDVFHAFVERVAVIIPIGNVGASKCCETSLEVSGLLFDGRKTKLLIVDLLECMYSSVVNRSLATEMQRTRTAAAFLSPLRLIRNI